MVMVLHISDIIGTISGKAIVWRHSMYAEFIVENIEVSEQFMLTYD